MSVKALTRSFAGGEITPEMYGRLDLDKYQTGLAECKNFQVLPHGPVRNRAGTKYVLETKDSSKQSVLVPFIYNTDQAYVLEVGDQYFRIHTEGSTVLEATRNITGITQANPGVVTSAAHGFSNGQWVYLASIGGMTQLNGRYFKVANVAANTFELTSIHGGANINTTSYTAYTAGGTAARVLETATPYLEVDLFDLHHTQSADVLTVAHEDYAPREISRASATSWPIATITFAPVIAAPTGVAVAASPASGATVNYYVVTAVDTSTLEESLASASANVANDLSVAGNTNTVSWNAVANVIRYKVYRRKNGLYGYIGETPSGTLSFADTNFLPDLTLTPPENNNPFTGASTYPRAVGYDSARRWFGGSINLPRHCWGTRSGTESNMTRSIPVRDDDSITVPIKTQRVGTVRHIVPGATDLIVLTSEAACHLRAQNTDVLTPSSVDPKTNGPIGASNVAPVVTSKSVLYEQARGGRIREMVYSWDSQKYESNDVSIMAPHLFDGYTIKSSTFTSSPHQTAWYVRSDGVLLGLTYVPEHKVLAWHQHNTDGYFESIAAIPEGKEDVIYAIVRRTVNTRTVRYVEKFNTRVFATLADSYFVDAGATYSGSAATVISGLWHLEGKTVIILADGAVVKGKVVTNGAVTLDVAASKVHIGIAYTSDLQTLPLGLEAEALGQGTEKNVNSVTMRVYQSSGIFAGPAFDRLREYPQRTTEAYGSPPAMVSKEIYIGLDPDWNPNAQICIRQVDPLPLTCLSLVPDTALGG